MSSLRAGVERWLFPEAPAERLALFRILVGVYAVLYLAIRAPAYLALTERSADEFAPVGVLAPLTGPLPEVAVVSLLVGVIGLGLAFTAGVAFRWVGPTFAVGLLVLTTYRSSWGQIIWLETLMVLHVLIVGFAPSADALAVTRRPSPAAPSPAYGGPLRLAALVLVSSYVVAGVAKLRQGGVDWLLGDSLRNHVAATAVRADLLGAASSPLGTWLVQHVWLFPPLAVATLVLELGAPLALLGGKVRTTWVVATWLLHVGVAALMFVTFPYPLSLVAFAPLYRLERLPASLAAAGRRVLRPTRRWAPSPE